MAAALSGWLREYAEIVLGAAFVALIFAWQWQFGRFDPLSRPPTALQRLFGIRWEDWEGMSWEDKMAVFGRQKIVTLVWAAVTLAVFLWAAAIGIGASLRPPAAVR